jgi:hypothetical protein
MILSDWGVVLIQTYFTTSDRRSDIKNAIIGDISALMPGIAGTEQWDRK